MVTFVAGLPVSMFSPVTVTVARAFAQPVSVAVEGLAQYTVGVELPLIFSRPGIGGRPAAVVISTPVSPASGTWIGALDEVVCPEPGGGYAVRMTVLPARAASLNAPVLAVVSDSQAPPVGSHASTSTSTTGSPAASETVPLIVLLAPTVTWYGPSAAVPTLLVALTE